MKTLCLCGVFEKSVVIVESLLVAEEIFILGFGLFSF